MRFFFTDNPTQHIKTAITDAAKVASDGKIDATEALNQRLRARKTNQPGYLAGNFRQKSGIKSFVIKN
ncbi:hypothetical protein [Enterobacter bugandensis]